MPEIEDIRNAVRSELEMLQMMAKMPPGEFEKLMKGQENYAKAIKAQAEAEKEKHLAKRREIEKEITEIEEKEQLKRTQMQTETRREHAEQDRKFQLELTNKQTEEEKKRVDYALQKETEVQKERTNLKLEARREFDKLDLERKKREEEIEEAKALIRKRERDEEYGRMAELEKTKIHTKAEMERFAEVELADHRFGQKLRMYEATKEQESIRKRELLTVEMEYQKQIAKQKWDTVLNYFSGDDGRDRVYNLARLVGLSAFAFGAVRVGVPLFRQYLMRFFFSPKLVNRKEVYSSIRSIFKRKTPVQVVLNPSLSQRMDRILLSTQKTAQRRGYYGNMLLYGRPGTGKTLWAEKLANEAKMDFVVMSGPSFDQFESGEAIQEIKNLFSWVQARRNGVLLFIDEADSFLEDRSTLHPHRVAVLNEWINQTGTESSKFMCVYETNRPEILDPAIQSRVSTAIEMSPPGEDELLQMLNLYVKKYVLNDRQIGMFKRARGLKAPYLKEEGVLEEIAKRFVKEGFVGRDVSNFAINLFKAGTGTGSGDSLSQELVDQVIEEQIHKKMTEKEYLDLRDQRLKALKTQLMSSFLK